MVELDEEEIQGLIAVGKGRDMREIEISAYATNKLMGKKLVGYGRGFLYLTKEGEKLFQKYKKN